MQIRQYSFAIQRMYDVMAQSTIFHIVLMSLMKITASNTVANKSMCI